eukprot:CAMPEP_0183740908 /NCGR_PEP_ID=MMETSP0737-20130205/60806_1 /TAXON_ID=385413 /ORGANISM="Thalassiosira miniscula, Strain CCMP1093" /LENGTH=241 /DNA_ID=CAMNT_0025976081 /DNA_START=110 /DNA_END=835 /DNA_ORIENTATION=-
MIKTFLLFVAILLSSALAEKLRGISHEEDSAAAASESWSESRGARRALGRDDGYGWWDDDDDYGWADDDEDWDDDDDYEEEKDFAEAIIDAGASSSNPMVVTSEFLEDVNNDDDYDYDDLYDDDYYDDDDDYDYDDESDDEINSIMRFIKNLPQQERKSQIKGPLLPQFVKLVENFYYRANDDNDDGWDDDGDIIHDDDYNYDDHYDDDDEWDDDGNDILSVIPNDNEGDDSQEYITNTAR